jgi:hypothetical protein
MQSLWIRSVLWHTKAVSMGDENHPADNEDEVCLVKAFAVDVQVTIEGGFHLIFGSLGIIIEILTNNDGMRKN